MNRVGQATVGYLSLALFSCLIELNSTFEFILKSCHSVTCHKTIVFICVIIPENDFDQSLAFA